MEEKLKQRPSADEVLNTLLEGNRRFVSGKLLHPNHCEESRQGVAEGQEPIATILTCADSRVPPVDIFDQGLGDIFVASEVKLDGHMATFVPPIQAAIKNVKDDEGDLVNNTARELARQMAGKIANSEPIIADFVAWKDQGRAGIL